MCWNTLWSLPKTFLLLWQRVTFTSLRSLALWCGDGSFFSLWLDYVNGFSERGPGCDHLHPWGGCGALWWGGCRKSHWSALAKAMNSCHFPVLFLLLHCRVRFSLHLPFPSAAHENSKQFLSHAQGNNFGVGLTHTFRAVAALFMEYHHYPSSIITCQPRPSCSDLSLLDFRTENSGFVGWEYFHFGSDLFLLGT